MKILSILLLLPLVAASPLASVERTLRMVSQIYGDGTNNIADLDDPLFLELRRTPAGWTGRLRAGEGGTPTSWPAFANDAGPLPVEVLSIVSGENGGVRARYRATPSPDDPLRLEIVEEYRLDERGDLVGTMTVAFKTPDGERGSFVLHRRFERVR